MLTFALNYAAGGLNPPGFHLANILLHGYAAVLLFFLLDELLKRRQAAFAAALLFAVHPIHAEAVAAVVGRMEILAAGFLFAAWLLHARGRAWAAALCFLLAALSKETGLVFLALAPVGDWVLGRARAWRSYAIYAGAAAVYLILRQNAVPLSLNAISTLDNPLAALSPVFRIANAVKVAGLYLGLQVFPARLSADYSANGISLHQSWAFAIAALAIAAAVMAAWLACIRRYPAIFLAGCIYGAGFALTANILFPIGTILGERLAYLPSAGFCLLAGLSLELPKKKVAYAILAVAVIALSARTVIRTFDWRNNLTLYTSAVEVMPESSGAHAGLGAEYLKRHEPDKAYREFQKAAAIYPQNPELGMMMGVIAFQQGDRVRATNLLKGVVTASEGSPNQWEMLTTYGALLLEMRQFDDAIAQLNSVIAHAPSSRAYANRAVAQYFRGDMVAARSDAQQALRINPSNEQAQNVLKRLP